VVVVSLVVVVVKVMASVAVSKADLTAGPQVHSIADRGRKIKFRGFRARFRGYFAGVTVEPGGLNTCP
jgi:hypothetical protein